MEVPALSRRPAENIGVVDAYLRLFGGLSLLALGAGRKFGRVGSFLAVVLGASKVAEGITRYCPLYDLLELSSAGGSLQPAPRPDRELDRAHREPAEAGAGGSSPGPPRRPLNRWGARAWKPRPAVSRPSPAGTEQEPGEPGP